MFPSFPAFGPVILVVIALLVAFSVASWSIIVLKAVSYSRIQRENLRFLDGAGDPQGPLARLFSAAKGHEGEKLVRVVRRVSSEESARLESGIAFLATTAGATPFIGLFGTVWGIMNAFAMVGQTGTLSLAVVAPGIAEALVTTALGLAVAVPALVGHNLLQARCRRLLEALEDGGDDLLAGRFGSSR